MKVLRVLRGGRVGLVVAGGAVVRRTRKSLKKNNSQQGKINSGKFGSSQKNNQAPLRVLKTQNDNNSKSKEEMSPPDIKGAPRQLLKKLCRDPRHRRQLFRGESKLFWHWLLCFFYLNRVAVAKKIYLCGRQSKRCG